MEFCEHCGEDKQEHELIKINGEYICKTCLEKHYFKCHNCGQYAPKQYLYKDSCWNCTTEDNGFYL